MKLNIKQWAVLIAVFLIIWFLIYYGVADYMQGQDRKKFIFRDISEYRENTLWVGLILSGGFVYLLFRKLRE